MRRISSGRPVPAQGKRLLVEHRLDRQAGGGGIEPVPDRQIPAIVHDRIDVLQLLEALELVRVTQPHADDACWKIPRRC